MFNGFHIGVPLSVIILHMGKLRVLAIIIISKEPIKWAQCPRIC
jgi:hypothetical protein